MQEDRIAQRTIRFVNIAHALDHFVVLIYPTAVLAIAAEGRLGYSELIGLATGTFLAFGLVSLPVGWVADRVGRRNLLAAFFLGCGVTCIGLSFASTPVAFAALLLVLGCFAAIYHPVGSAMLVSNASRLGRELGKNGVWGNLGAALASGITALIAAQLGWRAAFAIPGALAIGVGVLFLASVPSERGATTKPPGETTKVLPIANPVAIAALYLVAIVGGGITFNVVTIALPKVIDERLGFDLPLSAVGTIATSVFILGALTQLTMGRLVDRIELPKLFVGLSVLQPLGLLLATVALGVPMLFGLILAMASIYGQVVLNDAMIARYVAPHLRAKAFGLRYFIGFSVSGLAVPMIAVLHALDGFPAVLGVTALFGAMIFGSALGFFILTRPSRRPIPAGAE